MSMLTLNPGATEKCTWTIDQEDFRRTVVEFLPRPRRRSIRQRALRKKIMKNCNKDEFSVALRIFTETLGWEKAEIEHLRQDLIKADLIFKIGPDEFISAIKFGEYADNELAKLALKVAKSNSYKDIDNYTGASLSYLRSSYCCLSAIDFSKTTLNSKTTVETTRSVLEAQLPYYHKIYEHLLNALEISFGISSSKNNDAWLREKELVHNNPPGEGFDKKELLEDSHLATMAFPLETFNNKILLGGSEITRRHQNLAEHNVITELQGKKLVFLTRYGSYVLDDLEYLRLEAGTFHSDNALEDYAFFSFQYLVIWVNLLRGKADFKSPDGDKVSDEFIRSGWEKAIDCFRAIYRYTLNAIIILADDGR